MKPNGVRKGEWLEIPIPSGMEDPFAWMETRLNLPGKLLGKLERQNDIAVKGTRLRIRLFPPEEAEYEPEWENLDILYEDDFCLVVLKPAGMAVHPGRPGQGGTLANAVSAHYQATGQSCRIRHIHRLDEETSGPVLYAKNEYAHLLLDEQMRRKAIGRIYTAIVQGVPKPSSGRIEAPIGKDRHHPARRRVSPTGDPAATVYETVETFSGAACLRLHLETGRTHQIRVHLSSIGHPLIGDELYGGKKQGIGRQALHGESLVFLHPWTEEPVETKAPYPEDFSLLLSRLRQKA